MWSRDAVDSETFDSMAISTTHWIDVCNSYNGILINAEYLYEIFGAFSSKDSVTVRASIIKLIRAEYEFYASVGCVVLGIRGCNLDEWLEEMETPETIPDELMLYALSRAYNRHTLVFFKHRIWTTIEITEPMDEMALMSACNLHLVYDGEGVYGELKIKPFKGGVPDLINMEMLEMALSQICG